MSEITREAKGQSTDTERSRRVADTKDVRVQRSPMRVGAVNDPLEREADDVADDVMLTLENLRRRPAQATVDPAAGGRIRRAAGHVGRDGGSLGTDAEQGLQCERRGGRPLDDGARGS